MEEKVNVKNVGNVENVERSWIPIREVIRRTGVTKATIHHYLKIGLLPKPKKVNDRMAYYPPETIRRILFIKHLQTERFLPLSTIKKLIKSGMSEEEIELLDSEILEGYIKKKKYTKEEILKMIDEKDLKTLQDIGILSSGDKFTEEDRKIVYFIRRLREIGLNEENGFRVSDMSIYSDVCEKLIDREFEIFNKRMMGKLHPKDLARLAKISTFAISQILSLLHQRKIMERMEKIRFDLGEEKIEKKQKMRKRNLKKGKVKKMEGIEKKKEKNKSK